jgi:hypothetical protein
MALCAITQSAGLYSIYGSHGSDSSSSSRREWENNDLLLFFYSPPPILRSWRQQAFQSVSKCKAKAPGDPGPIFNLVEAQTRVNAPVALYRSIRTLGSPFERRNKSNMQQAYHGGRLRILFDRQERPMRVSASNDIKAKAKAKKMRTK